MSNWTYEYTSSHERRVVSEMPSYDCFVTKYKGKDVNTFLADVNFARDWIEENFDPYLRGIPRWDFKVDASTRYVPVPTGTGKPVGALVSHTTFVATWYFKSADDARLFKAAILDN